MNRRTLILMAIVIGAVVVVVVWNRQMKPAVVIGEVASGSAGSVAGSSSSNAPGSGSAGDKLRKIDRKEREALLDRIRTARTARTGGSPGPSSPGGAAAPPSLPALPGMLSKDDIRKGVRAVIPLLAECYGAAQERLPIKTGEIKVQMHLTGEPDIGTLIEKAEIGGDPQFTNDADLVECFQQTMLSVELPPIAEGGTIDVTYPIAFAPE